MFNGSKTTIELQFDRKLIDAIHDKFGESVEIIPCKRGLCKATVEILVSPVFFAWCFQFGKDMKTLSPLSVALEMKDHASANGLIMWPNSDGKTLRDLKNNEE